MSEESAVEPGAPGDDDAVADAQAAIDEARRRVAEPFDQARHGVDGEGRRHQIGLLGGQVDRRQLVETHHVVDDDDLGRRLGEEATTMRDALANIRMAFVELKGRTAATSP